MTLREQEDELINDFAKLPDEIQVSTHRLLKKGLIDHFKIDLNEKSLLAVAKQDSTSQRIS